ncbi:hypothetical protein QN395_21140 [Undibacterium sp. RTI2.2]|nr:hypothetical protein [Undibacterium sp. RTI2.2]
MKKNKRKILLGILLFQIGGVIFFLSALSNFFPTLNLWVRVAISGALLIGFVGSVLSIKNLFFLGKMGSWCFLLYVLATSIPDPDYYSWNDIKVPNSEDVVLRNLILFALGISMLICFWLLGKTSKRSPD